jgi:hypothetical protein
MMASTLAANSSTGSCASGREREQEIAPMASRRRYDCERLQLWIRWQINYLLGAPAILGIAIYYAHYLGFDTLVDV